MTFIVNNKLKREIEENKSLKTNYKKYVDNLFEQQNQELTTKISEKIQNIINIQYDGKISSNIIFTRGMIIVWCGNVYNIPESWALCDGSNQTPDLRNRFILGSGQQIPFCSIGGNYSIKLSKANLPPIGEALFVQIHIMDLFTILIMDFLDIWDGIQLIYKKLNMMINGVQIGKLI